MVKTDITVLRLSEIIKALGMHGIATSIAAGWYYLPDQNAHICISRERHIIARMKPKQ